MSHSKNCLGCKKNIAKGSPTAGVVKKYCSRNCYTSTLKNNFNKNTVQDMNNNENVKKEEIKVDVEEPKKEVPVDNEVKIEEMTAGQIITKVLISFISVIIFAVVAYSAYTYIRGWFLCLN